VSFCDSSGISMFFALHGKAVAAGGKLTIRDPMPAVRRVIEITQLDSVITVTG
jgi:anti-sigma B factor antagonist